jgi:hypothetical protein
MGGGCRGSSVAQAAGDNSGIVWLSAACKPRFDPLGKLVGRDLRFEGWVGDPIEGTDGDISELNH